MESGKLIQKRFIIVDMFIRSRVYSLSKILAMLHNGCSILLMSISRSNISFIACYYRVENLIQFHLRWPSQIFCINIWENFFVEMAVACVCKDVSNFGWLLNLNLGNYTLYCLSHAVR